MTSRREPSPGSTPAEVIKKGVQLCFCGPGAGPLPALPLEPHNAGCLIWDWAMATGMITPSDRTRQLDEHARNLGAGNAPPDI